MVSPPRREDKNMVTALRQFTADVLVVGSGTAGSLAALAAADEGASVILVELDFASGGTGTRGGIHSYYYGSHGGYQEKIDAEVKTLEATFGMRGGNFHPEAKRVVLACSLAQRGVTVLYHTILCSVDVNDGTIRSVRCCDDEGLLEIKASVVIDSTGDGDVAAAAGAEFTFGREFDGASHQYSFVPRRLLKRTPASRWEVSFDNYDAGWVDSTDPWDISRALRDGRRHMRDYFAPGEKNDLPQDIIGISPQLGIREGRHVRGDHVIAFLDFMRGRTYPDVICTAYCHYDSHSRDMANEFWLCQSWHVVMAMYRRAAVCQIPYRSILVRGISNLLVACRGISVDRETSMVVRMQRDMQKLGEAAGVAAALAARNHMELRALNIAQLQERLIARQVLLPSETQCNHVPVFTFSNGILAGKEWDAMTLSASPLAHADMIEPLMSYFGTDEEGKALWWLYLLRENDRSALVSLANNGAADYRQRRSAAFALAMMDDTRGVPMMLECLRRRDAESPAPAIKSYPRWVASLVLLRHLQAADAFEEALSLLTEPLEDRFYSFVLAYLHDIHHTLTPARRRQLAGAIEAFRGRTDVGRAYAAQGERSKRLDIRWNIDLWILRLCRVLGEEVAGKFDSYEHDSRPFVRKIWARFLNDNARVHSLQKV